MFSKSKISRLFVVEIKIQIFAYIIKIKHAYIKKIVAWTDWLENWTPFQCIYEHMHMYVLFCFKDLWPEVYLASDSTAFEFQQ